MTYDSESDPSYSIRPYPKTCFIHHWGWEVIECAPHRFRLLAGDWKPYGYIATFRTKNAAIEYMNSEFL